MPVLPSTESIDCKIFDSRKAAEEYGRGGIYYHFDEDSEKKFPEDVKHVFIMMPVSWQIEEGEDIEICAEYRNKGIGVYWDVKNSVQKGRWELSGTKDKPTLSPSLHWIDVWHGFLTDGHLRSC